MFENHTRKLQEQCRRSQRGWHASSAAQCASKLQEVTRRRGCPQTAGFLLYATLLPHSAPPRAMARNIAAALTLGDETGCESLTLLGDATGCESLTVLGDATGCETPLRTSPPRSIPKLCDMECFASLLHLLHSGTVRVDLLPQFPALRSMPHAQPKRGEWQPASSRSHC